jgi:hypothetical protein
MCTKFPRLLAMVWLVPLLVIASDAGSAGEINLTGLPMYPNLRSVIMDPLMRTDTLGRWCAHLTGNTSDSVENVVTWYRKTWTGANVNDLRYDPAYRAYDTLRGFKLAIGIDSVTVSRVTPGAPTSVELSRCSPIR